MFAKCKQLVRSLTPSTAENLADLLYDMGRALLGKHKYELAVRWLERAYEVLGDQDIELLSAEAGELRLSIMQSIGCVPRTYLKEALTRNSASTHKDRGYGCTKSGMAYGSVAGSCEYLHNAHSSRSLTSRRIMKRRWLCRYSSWNSFGRNPPLM
jgi:hypothetical protein